MRKKTAFFLVAFIFLFSLVVYSFFPQKDIRNLFSENDCSLCTNSRGFLHSYGRYSYTKLTCRVSENETFFIIYYFDKDQLYSRFKNDLNKAQELKSDDIRTKSYNYKIIDTTRNRFTSVDMKTPYGIAQDIKTLGEIAKAIDVNGYSIYKNCYIQTRYVSHSQKDEQTALNSINRMERCAMAIIDRKFDKNGNPLAGSGGSISGSTKGSKSTRSSEKESGRKKSDDDIPPPPSRRESTGPSPAEGAAAGAAASLLAALWSTLQRRLNTGSLAPSRTSGRGESVPPSGSGGGTILSGHEAKKHLEEKNMLTDGRLNDKFWDWYDGRWSDPSSAPGGVKGISGNFDPEARNRKIGSISIFIEGNVQPESDGEAATADADKKRGKKTKREGKAKKEKKKAADEKKDQKQKEKELKKADTSAGPICSRCGSTLVPGEVFCRKCGQKAELDDASEKDSSESPEEIKEEKDKKPARFRKKAQASVEPTESKAAKTAAVVEGLTAEYEGRILVDPETGRALSVNEDGLVQYGEKWLTPQEAYKCTQIDKEWFSAREAAQQKVDEFKKTLAEYNRTSDPQQKQVLEQRLRCQAEELNASYSGKNILKAEGRTETGEVFDTILHEKTYPEVDKKFVQSQEEMGFKRGGRAITEEDFKEYRNAASKGTVGMDRDFGLDEGKLRDLIDRLNQAEKGSPEAKDLAQKLAAEYKKTKLSLEPDKYSDYLKRNIADTNHRLQELRNNLENAPRGSQAAEDIQKEIDLLSQRPQTLEKELRAFEAKAKIIKEHYTKDLQRKLDRTSEKIQQMTDQMEKAQTGSEEARRLSRELEQMNKQSKKLQNQIADAETRIAGKSEIPVSPSTWGEMSEPEFRRTYSDVTKTDGDKADLSLTHRKSKDAYQDLDFLKGDPAAHPPDKGYAEQTSSVSRIKEIENKNAVAEGKFTRGEKIQETARGYAKDMDTKVNKVLGNDARVDPRKLDMLKRIQKTFDKIGKGEIKPGQANQALQRAVPEVAELNMEKATRIVDANFEAGIKWGKPAKISVGDVYGVASDAATVNQYYEKNLAAGMGKGEALAVATGQTWAGNAAAQSGVADPRLSMAASSLLPEGINNVLPDQCAENLVGTAYQAGKAGWESLSESFSTGRLNTEALDKFTNELMSRPGADPWKGYALAADLATEARTDGGDFVGDLKKILWSPENDQPGGGKFWEGSTAQEVAHQSMEGFQKEVAGGDHGVVLEGLNHVAETAAEFSADPAQSTEIFINDCRNILDYGVEDGYWGEAAKHTWKVVRNAPVVKNVLDGYGEIYAGIEEKGFTGFGEDMLVGAMTIQSENLAEHYSPLIDAAAETAVYIRKFF